MRRIYGALVLAILLQLAAPGPALGWWENIEPWSGPGWWKGFDIDARLFCLVDNIPSVRKDALVARMQKNAARPAFTPLPSQVPGQVEAQRGLVKAVNTEVGQWKATLDEWESILNEWQRYAGLAGDRVAAVRQPLADVRARADTSLDRIDPATEAWIASTGARTAADEAIRRAQQDATRAADEIQRATETIRRIVDQPRIVPSALPGVLYSACRLQQEERRRAAFDIGMRFVWTHDDRYADGERINFTTIEPAFSWNVFSNPNYDVVEYGLGAGFYWVSSKAFPSFTGGFLEPIRLDFHFPTRFVSNETMTRKIIRSVVFRAGYLVFPGGFEPDAFLADPLNPETHRRISRDWVRYYGIYVDTEVFRKKS
jgi:hypothetical protein